MCLVTLLVILLTLLTLILMNIAQLVLIMYRVGIVTEVISG